VVKYINWLTKVALIIIIIIITILIIIIANVFKNYAIFAKSAPVATFILNV